MLSVRSSVPMRGNQGQSPEEGYIRTEFNALVENMQITAIGPDN
jgi:hypothetical protein